MENFIIPRNVPRRTVMNGVNAQSTSFVPPILSPQAPDPVLLRHCLIILETKQNMDNFMSLSG